jgi:hypothetical protein
MIETALSVIGIIFWTALVVLFVWVVVMLADVRRAVVGLWERFYEFPHFK